jgi:hypothetical protein
MFIDYYNKTWFSPPWASMGEAHALQEKDPHWHLDDVYNSAGGGKAPTWPSSSYPCTASEPDNDGPPATMAECRRPALRIERPRLMQRDPI